jgi:hypothetical protein
MRGRTKKNMKPLLIIIGLNLNFGMRPWLYLIPIFVTYVLSLKETDLKGLFHKIEVA